MAEREKIEKLLVEIQRRREEAEARATKAAEGLVRTASLLTPLDEQDPQQIEGAADDYAAAVRELQLLADFARKVRELLM